MANPISSHIQLNSKMIYGVVRKNLNFPFVGMHRRIEIVLVTEGELTMRINSELRTVKPGYAVFLDAYDAHAFYTYNESCCAIIEFFPEFCREIFAPFYNWLSAHTVTDKVIKIPDEIFNCVLYLLPKKTDEMEYYDELPSHFFAILAPLFHAIMTESNNIHENKQSIDLYNRAANYIIENYDKELSRETVAYHVGVRPQSLSRIFSRKMQMTFVEYVQYVRLQVSLRHIESGENISSAALLSGFDSIRTYNRVFKRFFGKTPREYLKLK